MRCVSDHKKMDWDKLNNNLNRHTRQPRHSKKDNSSLIILLHIDDSISAFFLSYSS
jgi:hypothetical protein